ncbi:MAG TPA: hypothetical protein PK400_00545 [Phycisphaerales bacterium]|nr:hypothetical protein [Phycisphaerales bacterium]HRQ74444.1 hypothetical protein [Phycisphaerales bacterium]
MGRLSSVMAACFALAAFAVATFAGLAVGNAATLVLMQALLAMVICYPVGLIVGIVCERVIDMHLASQAEQEAATMGTADKASAASTPEDEDVIVV